MHTHTRASGHTHARQRPSLLGPEGARQGAGEFRPPSLSSAAPSSPKRSGLRPDGRGRSRPGSLILSWRRHCSQNPFPWSLPPPQGPHLNRSKCISIPCGLQPVTKQPATECLCLSVCPTPRPARNKAVPWDVSAGVQGLVSSGEPSHPGRRGLIFSSSGLGCRWGSLESEPQDCLPRCRDALLSGATPRSGVRHPICTPSLGTSRHAASSASTTVPLPPLAPSHSGPSL